MTCDPPKRVFTLPENAQLGSRLLQLPSEIRLLILQKLLRNRTSLTSAASHTDCCTTCTKNDQVLWRNTMWFDYKKTAGPGGRNFSFHPSILTTCQTLCSQGYQVLYGSNEARLEVCISQLENKINVCAFDSPIDRGCIPAPASAGFWKHMRRFRIVFNFWIHSRGVDGTENLSPASKVASDFTKACRVLAQSLPRHANVTISIIFRGGQGADVQEAFFRYCLPWIGLLRCEELHFDQSVPEIRATPICNTVTSDADSLDLPVIASAIYYYFASEGGRLVRFERLPFMELPDFDRSTTQTRDDLWDAVQAWDVEKFSAARRELQFQFQLQMSYEAASARIAEPFLETFGVDKDRMDRITEELRSICLGEVPSWTPCSTVR